MIKNRFFMLGLGIGLIAGALLLQLMIAGKAAPLTKEQLIKEAERLNLTVVDHVQSPDEGAASGEEEAQEGNSAGTPESSQVPAEEAATASPAPAATPKAAVEPSAAVTPGKPSAPVQPESSAADTGIVAPASPEAPAVAVNGDISVRIPTGITLAQTADVLAGAGVIQDKAEFLKKANSRKVNKIIQYGSYSFAKGESVDSIIDKLITVKK
ncbi:MULTISPECIES: hypothetical protein [unclassified Paenibacillus]|uniref:hypothetical protein n=1 Tax=unclassified Paenibacillus TaxID=185978 RepID=UPI0004F73D11|nr:MULTISPECIES: hypothetical protein [unclassified Paenibacillus]AIQ30488.1 hypothetical protein P40081_21735 [Paenibacillus sp. FSL P4-0081]OMF23631.1 hypothetical protein BK132_26355 [Paenibacillus sp. FSL H8-0259]